MNSENISGKKMVTLVAQKLPGTFLNFSNSVSLTVALERPPPHGGHFPHSPSILEQSIGFIPSMQPNHP